MTAIVFLFLTLAQGAVCEHWQVMTPRSITASKGSCVWVPCSFSRPAMSALRVVMWLKGNKTDGTLVINSNGASETPFKFRAWLREHWQINKECTLKINELTQEDEGWYYFRMENNDGGKYSGPDGVLVNISDGSSLPPISATEEITEGMEVVLTCSVKYSCPGDLKWEDSNSLVLPTLSETLGTLQNEGRTSLTLRFLASYLDHGRTLRCRKMSTLVQSITLNVKYAPRFAYLTLSPFKVIRAGNSVTVRCGVGASNPPVTRYTWHWSGFDSRQWSDTSTATNIIFNVQRYQEHWCEAINSVGTVASEKTKLPIYDSNSWAVWTPLSVRAREGSCVIIPCQFRTPRTLGRGSAPTGIWLTGHHFHGDRVYHTTTGSSVNYTERVEFLGNMESGNCSVMIQNLRASDSGKYYFRIEASFGKWSDQIGLKLLVSENLERPAITVPASVVDGVSVTLTCSVSSYCPEETPVFQWLIPDLYRAPEMKKAFRDHQWIYSSTVALVPSFENREQPVKCTTNFGPGTSSEETEISLDLKYPPQNVSISLTINWGKDPLSIKEMDRVTLSCNAMSAHPAVTKYAWYRDGSEVQDGSVQSNTLHFASISYADYGTYVCEASNEAGSRKSEELTVTGKYRPQDVHIEYRVNDELVREPMTIKEGNRLRLTCLSGKSEPPVSSYAWHNDSQWYISQKPELLFDRITRHQSARYHCQAQNAIGTGSSKAITVDVLYPPTNVRITSRSAVGVGEDVTLLCASEANPAVSWYSWRKVCGFHSTPLRAYREQYQLRSSLADASCAYYCTARNSLGNQESPPRRIDVQYPPTNVRITSRSTVGVGEYVTLSCASEANPAVSWHSWRKVCSSKPTYLGRHSQEYGLRVSLADASCEYYCTARNSFGDRESPPLRIDVQYPPNNVRITSRSAVGVGEYVTLSCAAEANPAVSGYSWRKVCGSKPTSLEYSGQQYQLRVSLADASCAYYCTARNSLGNQESPPRRIDVQYQPQDVNIKSVDSAVEGTLVTLHCDSVSNPPAQTYQWKKECSGKAEMLEGATSDIQIHFSNEDQSCDYFCIARNLLGSQNSQPKRFNVQYGPRDTKVVFTDRSGRVREGESLTLRCRSRGSPPPRYSWYKGPTPLRNAGQELTFESLHPSHSGNYSCQATNWIGKNLSPAVLLDVLYGPRDTTVSVSQAEVQEGDNVTLTCSSDGNPPVRSFRWLRSDGVCNTTLEVTGGRLHLVRVTPRQAGVYFCLARGDEASQTSVGVGIWVLGSLKRKIIASVIPILIIPLLVITVFLFIRYRKRKQNSLTQWTTDATNVIYSVVKKPTKGGESTVYENTVLTESAHSHSQSSVSPEESVHASVSFRHGHNWNRSDQRTETAWTVGSRIPEAKVRVEEPSVVYSQVCVQPRTTKTPASEDYENVGQLFALANEESDEEIDYTTVVHGNHPKPGLRRKASEESIEYTNLRF